MVLNKVYGYCRISRNHNESKEIQLLRDAGVADEFIFVDKCSGVDSNKLQYKELKKMLRPGDLLIIKSINSLSRNNPQAIKEGLEITRKIKADITVLDMPMFNKSMISGYLEDLRTCMKQRQAIGIAYAKAQGEHLGRPKVNR